SNSCSDGRCNQPPGFPFVAIQRGYNSSLSPRGVRLEAPTTFRGSVLMPHAPRRMLLPRYLTGIYAFLIVYASLQPFSGWTVPAPGTVFFLWAPQTRETASDVIINLVAYWPLGLLGALSP